MSRLDNKYKLYLKCILMVAIFKLPVFLICFDSEVNNVYMRTAIDSYIHLLIGFYPISWQSFSGVFPIGCTIIFKIFNYDIRAYNIFLFLYSTIAWSMLLFNFNFYVSNTISKSNKFLMNSALLLFMSSLAVGCWDTYIGSDSLTLSTLVVIMTLLFLFYIDKFTTASKAIFIIALCYFILIRDSNYIIVLYILAFLLACKNISKKYKLLTSSLIVMTILITSMSASEFRSHIHFRDILALYIIENDSALESGKSYYDWYMKNTTMPDIKSEYERCDKSYTPKAFPRELPKYPFVEIFPSNLDPKTANFITSFMAGENCLPLKNPEFNKYFNSNLLQKDYFRFLLSHPSFLLFASGKYLPITRFMILSPTKTPDAKNSDLPIIDITYNHKVIFYVILHLFYILLQILIWKELLFSRKKIKLIWLFGVFIPGWLFAWLCFIAEPMELVRHLLAGEWYMIIGGFYLILFEKYENKLKS